MEVRYNPDLITYRELLNVFWNLHNPVYPTNNRQYMSLVLYHDDAEREEAMALQRQIEAEGEEKIYTEILPLEDFYLAEGYHQKYYLQNTTKLYKKIKGMFDNNFSQLVSSTLAARVNGYVAGSISLSELKEELSLLEISEEDYKEIVFMAEEIR